ncbi:MAG: hypothetical protein ACJAT3_002425 [Akkermansiaceae bacterium]|jgi:hypothetical protein|tara:strand:+ start:2770 stop:3396 length:627 start_codon:yes stop_codon:yes gene_type:complete
MNKEILLRGTIVLGLIWAIVWGVMAWSGSQKATPQKVVELIGDGTFEDWSDEDPSGFPETRKKERLKSLDELGEVINRLDLRQFEQVEESGDVTSLSLLLSAEEKMYFADLVVFKRTAAFMNALDKMEPDERKETIDRAVKALTRGDNMEALDKLMTQNPEVIDEIANKGMRAFYQEASAETKMELSPFLNAVGKVVQGFEQPGRKGL